MLLLACLQIGTPTVYAGLTLGGVLATSAHGSGHQAASGIWDTILEITWVDGTGKVRIASDMASNRDSTQGSLIALNVREQRTRFL